MTLGQRIQEERKKMGLSQEALGEKLGVSRQAISKWEADGAVPEVDKLIALGRLFGVTLNAFLQVEGPAGAAEDEEKAAEAYTRKFRRQRILKNISHGLTAALVLVFAIALGVLWQRVNLLEEFVAVVEAPALDAAAPLVSAFDYHFVDASIDNAKVRFTLNLSLLPTQSTENMTVTFQLTHPDYPTELLPAERAEGGTAYSVSHPFINYYPGGMTISAVFDDGTRQYTQALIRISNWSPDSWSWDSFWDQD